MTPVSSKQKNEFRSRILNQVGERVWCKVRLPITRKLESQTSSQVYNRVGNGVWSLIWGQMTPISRVWNQVYDKVYDQAVEDGYATTEDSDAARRD